MLALAIFAILALAISAYQLRVQLYRQAAQQLYIASSLCENMIEQWRSGASIPTSQTIVSNQFEIKTLVTPGPNQAYKSVQVCATWMSALQRLQTIKFDIICL